MKKFLLLFAMALLASGSVWAGVDPNTYAGVDGINIKNLWLRDRVHHPDEFVNEGFCNTRARTGVMHDGIVYVARSEAKQVIVGNDTTMAAVIYRLNAKTGEQLPALDVTLDGAPYGVFLGVNQIGFDNFGHMWIIPYTSETATSLTLYQADTQTGALTKIASLEKGDALARTDYADVLGDITRQQAECNVMSPSANDQYVYRWHADQGGDFEGGWDGDTYLSFEGQFYPETVTQWGTAPMVKMTYDPNSEEPYSGNLFYVDGFNSMPILYDVSGTMIDNFENVSSDLWPENGTNGIAEFTLEGKNFVAYSNAQYTGVDKSGVLHACQINVCEMGEGQTLGGMKRYWELPADGLGMLSDGGLRIHCINAEYATEDGNNVVYLFDFKSYNGIGVYKIGKNVSGGDQPATKKGDLNGDGQINTTDVTELVNAILAGSTGDVYDIDGDGSINTTDVTELVNLVLAN